MRMFFEFWIQPWSNGAKPGMTYSGIDFQGIRPCTLPIAKLSFRSQRVGPIPMSCVLFSLIATVRTEPRGIQNAPERDGDLLYRLAAFRFDYASPHPQKPPSHRDNVRQVHAVARTCRVSELIRYFLLQWSWDNHNRPNSPVKTATRVRAEMKRSCGEPFIIGLCQMVPGSCRRSGVEKHHYGFLR